MGNSREAARQKILDWKQNLKFPRSPRASVLAMDFIKKLLCEPEDRLGYVPPSKRRGSFSAVPALDEPPLGHDGVEQLMNHPWFFGMDWKSLHEQIPPYQPNLQTPDDTQHFDDDIPDEVRLWHATKLTVASCPGELCPRSQRPAPGRSGIRRPGHGYPQAVSGSVSNELIPGSRSRDGLSDLQRVMTSTTRPRTSSRHMRSHRHRRGTPTRQTSWSRRSSQQL